MLPGRGATNQKAGSSNLSGRTILRGFCAIASPELLAVLPSYRNITLPAARWAKRPRDGKSAEGYGFRWGGKPHAADQREDEQ
jgi:hypothetical protein